MIKKLTKELVKELADDIMINLNDKEIDKIISTDKKLLDMFEEIKKIDTKNVEQMHFPFDNVNTYLREDDDQQILEQKKVLDNAPAIDGDYIKIVKVVK